jgi:hypothetical protein
MSDHSTTAPYYQLPESAHAELARVRDELDMFADLILHVCRHDKSLRTYSVMLSNHFMDMSVGISEVLAACVTSPGHAAIASRSHH